jgi:hypothetical protein
MIVLFSSVIITIKIIVIDVITILTRGIKRRIDVIIISMIIMRMMTVMKVIHLEINSRVASSN